ncbi:MAG TPA: flagellar biosynthesis protein FliQ [Firmicutes bacterium]|nr:flagellar biosynthesis protein FliQ [Bacillota bacterium]HHY97480.1 flagellar biosynthesis protein FliQ [Bacillota bacterium]
MTPEFVLGLGQRAIWVTLQVTLPIFIFALVTGVVVSILQAVTQIQEVTLAFVPKILAVILALVIFGPWMLKVLVGLAAELFSGIPGYIG